MKQMKPLLNELNSGGDVARAEVVAFLEEGGATHHMETVIDASVVPAARVYYVDLRGIGPRIPMSWVRDDLSIHNEQPTRK